MPETKRYDRAALTFFAKSLFAAAGLAADKAAAVAETLVTADAMGVTTHGLALASNYVSGIERGLVACHGEPQVLSDRGACIAWDGRHLPGAWLTRQAIDLAILRSRTYGMATVAIGNSHHIGALAAYLSRATDRGLLLLLSTSSPAGASVAPFGGTRGLFSPNPFGAGIPTGGAPIWIDTSASTTTRNMTQRMIREGRTFAHPWLMEADGTPTGDPAAIERGGTILPAGGLDHGQKGFALALIIEALTQGLAGTGRADATVEQQAGVFVQVIDPDAFAGRIPFNHQLDTLVAACRSNPPRPGVDAVRLPGDRALASLRDADATGVALHPGIATALAPLAARFGLELPAAVAG